MFTKSLPSYFLLKVTIYVLENRTTNFSVDLPSVGYILSLLKFSKLMKVRVHDRIHDKAILCVNVYSLLKLAKLKFPYCNLRQSFPIIMGTVKSMNLVIIINIIKLFFFLIL